MRLCFISLCCYSAEGCIELFFCCSSVIHQSVLYAVSPLYSYCLKNNNFTVSHEGEEKALHWVCWSSSDNTNLFLPPSASEKNIIKQSVSCVVFVCSTLLIFFPQGPPANFRIAPFFLDWEGRPHCEDGWSYFRCCCCWWCSFEI